MLDKILKTLQNHLLKRDHSIKDIHVEPIIKKTMNLNKTEVREIIKSEAKCAPPPTHTHTKWLLLQMTIHALMVKRKK